MGKITIQEIAKTLVEKNGLDQREANLFATEMFSVIMERLSHGEQVKVKGLGTWKIIDVEPRESISVRTGERVVINGHSKVSFTPDAMMKELVNKPFSQFETVILNDGVEFEDLADDVTEEELAAVEQHSPVEPSLAAVATLDDSDESSLAAGTDTEDALSVDAADDDAVEPDAPVDEIEKKEQLVADEVVPLVNFGQDDEKNSSDVDESSAVEMSDSGVVEMDENSNQPDFEGTSKTAWTKWLLAGGVCLLLMAVSAFGGYKYGVSRQSLTAIADTVVLHDTLFMAELSDMDIDSLDDELAVSDSKDLALVSKDTEEHSEKVVKDREDTSVLDEPDPYAQKDERVRLGAYRIVGLDHEVKVLQGQTFYSICRAHLGPDMECYIEVYNDLPRNPQIKAGQIIKIPKLQLKKRKR